MVVAVWPVSVLPLHDVEQTPTPADAADWGVTRYGVVACRPAGVSVAAFQLKEAVNLMEMGVLLRPKYTDNMYKFIEEQVEVVKKAIDAEDWDAFEAAFHEMIDCANAYHEVYDKPYLRWKIPDHPPPDLDMTPRG